MQRPTTKNVTSICDLDEVKELQALLGLHGLETKDRLKTVERLLHLQKSGGAPVLY